MHSSLFLKHYELLLLIKQRWEYTEHLQKIKELQYSVDSAFFILTAKSNKLFFGIYLNVKYSNQGSKANLVKWFISQKLSCLFFSED